ncbi:hypothetical protein [Exiguobacterium sp. JMULE1]|uniref:hypothetical protein n=1 Tax=Exiguobacterium sp. JMULE1 TaxID=2518339 RepID=UPI0020C73D4E|nr:hypothetical protein [Exiguobacterium sp. JMULE1]
MENILKNGLLGKDVNYVLNNKPSSIIYGGVIFPNSVFKGENEIEIDNKMDPDVRFNSISKNVSMGMEFLVNKSLPLSFKLSGEFSFFIRVKPTFQEQMNSLQYLDINIKESEKIETKEYHKSKGLSLVEKYKKITFVFKDLTATFKNNNLIIEENDYLRVLEEFNSLIQIVRKDLELFKVKKEYVNKKGIINIPKIFESEEEYDNFINNISDLEESLPNYDFELKVNLLDYLHNPNSQKVIVSLINSSINNNEFEFHPIEFYDSKIEVYINEDLHTSFIFDGVRNNYMLDNKFKVKGLNCTAIVKQIENSKN